MDESGKLIGTVSSAQIDDDAAVVSFTVRRGMSKAVFDIDRLVAHIGYSRTQVFTLFRENTGLTPADFLTRLRVKKACSLLETTALPACRIARECGFSSASAFNAVFRRQTGTTPLAWRGKSG